MTRRVRLTLDTLNSREVPSALFVTAAPADAALGVPNNGQNQPPKITDFKAVVGPNGEVTFTGVVTDDQAVAGYVVHITGSGVDATATVQADGTFRMTAVVTGPSDVTVMVQVTDSQGATSNPVYTMFTPSA